MGIFIQPNMDGHNTCPCFIENLVNKREGYESGEEKK